MKIWSNNGSQHLSALTKDEITAPHVNLVPLDLPGDLYKYVADHVWSKLSKIVNEIDTDTIKECEKFIDNIVYLKHEIAEAPAKSDKRKESIEKYQKFKSASGDVIDKSAPIFWNRITDSKQRRKVVKRNVMTLPYGGTAYGLGLLAQVKLL